MPNKRQEESTKSIRKAYGETLVKLGHKQDNILVLDADLSKCTMTQLFSNEFPERFVNCGIAESNMMCVAAGLASCGHVVFVSTFAMFAAGRAFDQIRNSISYNNLNVKICATHAGITVGEDGASHQSIEDVALMRVIPNMKVLSPCDAVQTEKCIELAFNTEGPFYVRLSRIELPYIYHESESFDIKNGKILRDGCDITIFATGIMVHQALEVANMLEKDKIFSQVIDIFSIKPLDRELIVKCAQKTKLVVTIEEHTVYGGLGSAISEVLSQYLPTKILIFGINDKFGRSGTYKSLLKSYELDAESIYSAIIRRL